MNNSINIIPNVALPYFYRTMKYAYAHGGKEKGNDMSQQGVVLVVFISEVRKITLE